VQLSTALAVLHADPGTHKKAVYYGYKLDARRFRTCSDHLIDLASGETPVPSNIFCDSLASSAQPRAAVFLPGRISEIGDDSVTINTAYGSVKAALAADIAVSAIKRGTWSDLKEGKRFEATALPQPDGTLKAVNVFVYPQGINGASPPTNTIAEFVPRRNIVGAVITKVGVAEVAGQALILSSADGEKKVLVPGSASIFNYSVGNKALLVLGSRVVLRATPVGSTYLVTAATVGKFAEAP
jgi:hypothetical protein